MNGFYRNLRNVMRMHSIILLMLLCILGGCIIQGDSVINATGHNITVVVYSQGGQTLKREMWPQMHFGERRRDFKDKGIQYQKIEAFDNSGKKLGSFEVSELSNTRQKYGQFMTMLIVEDGIFPVPPKYLDWPEAHIAEIIQFFRQQQQEESQKLGIAK